MHCHCVPLNCQGHCTDILALLFTCRQGLLSSARINTVLALPSYSWKMSLNVIFPRQLGLPSDSILHFPTNTFYSFFFRLSAIPCCLNPHHYDVFCTCALSTSWICNIANNTLRDVVRAFAEDTLSFQNVVKYARNVLSYVPQKRTARTHQCPTALAAVCRLLVPNCRILNGKCGKGGHNICTSLNETRLSLCRFSRNAVTFYFLRLSSVPNFSERVERCGTGG
jgi:hypothetical protein